MVKRKISEGKKIKQWFEYHPVWVILAIVSFVLSLAIAAGTVFSFTTKYVEDTILWKNTEQRKIDSLAPTQTVQYFTSILGEPNTKSVRDGITRLIYKERGYWVETFSDSDDVVQLFDITACGDEGFYPKIKNNPVGPETTLGKTKMINTTGNDIWLWKERDAGLKIHYFLRGATAPSYYYDEYYAGNPGNYQTVFTGHNELCGYLVLPKDIDTALFAAPVTPNPLSAEQVNRLRKNVTINTFAVTSPSFDIKLPKLANIANGGIGVSYVDEGVLLPTRTLKNSKSYDQAKDFEVLKF